MMPSPASLTANDIKYVQSATPVMYSKNHLKPPSRKLWQKENIMGRADSWRNPDDDKWDMIAAPRFVNFSDLPDTTDSFFNNVTVIVSTPKPDVEHSGFTSSVHQEDKEENTLVASLSSFNLSEITQEPREKVYEPCNGENIKAKEESGKNAVDNDFQQKNKKKEECGKVKKPQPTMVHPFTFEMRDKQKQELKQERIKQILEEEKKMRMFRAKPVPKFLKTRPLINKNGNDNNNHNHSGNNNDKVDVAIHNKIQKIDIHKKPTKNTEVWKKPPFVPCLSRENPKRPKTPPLRTTVRAQQRKHFDDSIKERQRQKEQALQMEIAAKKKQEEEQIALLRKQAVHKAQPIRKYKSTLPKVEKRPLTDPITPLSFKRRRHV